MDNPSSKVLGFGTELVEQCRKGLVDPVIGREAEIERALQILCRKTKNNPVIVGEAGVGKTAIVEGIAHRIANGSAPPRFKGAKILSIDLSGLVSGAKLRGMFEENLRSVIKLAQDSMTSEHGPTIVFIDEIHQIVGAGQASGAMDAANILKPGLSRGKMLCIGATTINEYERYIASDSALERRFQKILVPPPSIADTITILRGLRSSFESHHSTTIEDKALVASVVLSDRFVKERNLPDKAVDLLDEACAARSATSILPTNQSKELNVLNEKLAEANQSFNLNQATELQIQLNELKKGIPEATLITAEDIVSTAHRATGQPKEELLEALASI